MPKGLYPVPRHHLYGSGGRRPTFSAKDFDNSPEPQAEAIDAAGGESNRQEAISAGAQRNHLHGNSGARPSFSAKTFDHSAGKTATPAHACNNINMDGATPDKKREKKARKSGAGDSSSTDIRPANLQSAMSSPNTTAERSKLEAANEMLASATAKSHKKRKHEREAIRTTGNMRPSSKVAKIAAQYDQLLAAPAFPSASLNKQAEDALKKDKKKKKRESSKRHSDFIADSVNDAPVTNITSTGQPASSSKKQKAVKADAQHADSRHEAQNFSSPVKKSHIPLPGEDTPAKAASARKHDAAEPAKAPIIQVHSSPIKKSHIPIPAPATHSALRTAKGVKNLNDPETVIPETPPSRTPKVITPVSETPIPLPLSSSMSEPLSSPSRQPKVPTTLRKVTVSHPFSSKSAAEEKTDVSSVKKTSGGKYLGWRELADKVKKPIKQPLTDGPKPKPRPKLERSRSRSASVSSNGSKSSIPEMFSRMAQSLDDPFNTLKASTSKHAFNQLFSQLRGTVHFTTELEYLAQYNDWHTENTSEYPIPCLRQLTLCNPNREDAIRQMRVDCKPSYYLRKKLADGPDLTAMHAAADAIKQTEKFLELSLRAQVPVPIGALAGTWSLYAPAYSVHHHDAYADGTRKLIIFSTMKLNTYKADLSMPPRSSVPIPIRKFAVSPHASFRTVIVKTEQEGYEMDVVFLGNGYLHLRVDLNLLLKGTPTESGERKVWMEFVGVHEGAVEWSGKEDRAGEDSDLEIVMDE